MHYKGWLTEGMKSARHGNLGVRYVQKLQSENFSSLWYGLLAFSMPVKQLIPLWSKIECVDNVKTQRSTNP